MDRKSIIVLVISFVLLMSWPVLMNKVYPPKPAPRWTNLVSHATNQIAESTNVPGANVAAVPPSATTNVPAPARETVSLPIPPGTQEKLEVVTNDNARYTFTSFGGGLKLVELLHYPEEIECHGKKALGDNLAKLNTLAPLPVLALRDGPTLEDAVYKLTPIPGGMRAEKTLSNGLYLVKEFIPSTNFLINATVRIENRSAQPIILPPQEWMAGTATPMGREENPQMLGAYWYNGTKESEVNSSWFANRFLGCFPGTPRTLYEAGLNNVAWVAVHNQFFTLAIMPKEPAPKILVTEVDLPSLPPAAGATSSKPAGKAVGLQASLHYPALTLSPKQTVERQFTIYAGPKEYRILQQIGLAFNNNLDLIMGYSGFFGFFAKLLLLSMNGLAGLGLSYALAIIAITIIIKALFWPLTQVSTRSMKRMQVLQPQIKALQEKYKEDPAKMNRKMMEFMKEHKVNPMGGCLPMLIQIPVFFGFYRMIQNAIELRGASFLWVCDLSKPDTIFFLPGLNFPVNPLPLIMGVTMLWQARLTPASPGMDPMQQKMMKYMPLIFLFLLYNFSAGLTLYWTVQNLLTIAQMKLTKTKDDSASGKAPPPSVGPRKK